MKSRYLTALVLAASIGCTQGTPPEVADPADLNASVSLPDPSATLIRFACPGMT